MSPTNTTLRPARRDDIPDLARVANAANARSALHKRLALHQDLYPQDYYQWRLNILRQRFAAPDLRTIVAEDGSTGQTLGFASWAVEGSETALYQRWVGGSSWMDWLEGKLVEVEKTWCRYFTNRCMDYAFLDEFMAGFVGAGHSPRPACLHPHLIVVDPGVQAKGVGRVLVDWGKEVAVEEGLPIYLEANLESTGFYEKVGFARLGSDFDVSPDGIEHFVIPTYVWEGEQRRGRWLENDANFAGPAQKWKWRHEVLPSSNAA